MSVMSGLKLFLDHLGTAHSQRDAAFGSQPWHLGPYLIVTNAFFLHAREKRAQDDACDRAYNVHRIRSSLYAHPPPFSPFTPMNKHFTILGWLTDWQAEGSEYAASAPDETYRTIPGPPTPRSPTPRLPDSPTSTMT
ncbi:hypothetical protein V2G26_011296 [Clonostachys chloroleuca]